MTSETMAAIEEKFSGMHDCAPRSLLRAVPELDPGKVKRAFSFCARKWPYGGVSNKEFAVAVKFLNKDEKLGMNIDYRSELTTGKETLAELLERKPSRCVALIWGHFIAIRDGVIAGRELLMGTPEETEVVCSWEFS